MQRSLRQLIQMLYPQEVERYSTFLNRVGYAMTSIQSTIRKEGGRNSNFIVVVQWLGCVLLFVTPWTVTCLAPLSMGFPRHTRMCCHFLLQGIFPSQGSNPGLLHCRRIHVFLMRGILGTLQLSVVALVAQSGPTLCDPVDCNPPGSSDNGISREQYWSGLPFPSSTLQQRNSINTIPTRLSLLTSIITSC